MPLNTETTNNIAFLLLVHKDAKQVDRLIKKLTHPNFYFFIHVDKKEAIDNYTFLADNERTVVLTEQINVKWGGYSIVGATLVALKAAIAQNIFSTFTVMSGQDFPIKSNQYIHRFFQEHTNNSFIYHEENNLAWWKGCNKRIEQIHFTEKEFKGKDRIAWFMSKFMPKREIPLGAPLYGGPGSGWWAISLAAAKAILNRLESDTELVKFLQYTWASDEFIIQSILMQSDEKKHAILRSLWHMHWPKDTANPSILRSDNFNELIASDALFARKFDESVDAAILEKLEDYTK